MAPRSTLNTKNEDLSRRDPSTKPSEHRLRGLEVLREPGNVVKACRRHGLDRTSYYERRRRFQTQGAKGPEGSAADPPEPPADDTAGSSRADRGAVAGERQ